jgi:hypothetical protein
MTTFLFVDNVYGNLASGLTVGQTSISLVTGHGVRFPAVTAPQVLLATLLNTANILEQIHITAHSPASDTLTVTRGANGTTAKAWAAGDRIECRITSEVFKALFSGSPAVAVNIAGPLTLGDVTSGTTQWLQFAIGNQTDEITAGLKFTTRFPACTLLDVRASVATASSSGAITFNIYDDGGTLFSTKPTIDVGQKSTETAATPYVFSSTTISDDSEMTFYIDGAGASAVGPIVTMQVRWT